MRILKFALLAGSAALLLSSCTSVPPVDAKAEIANYCAGKPIRFSQSLDLSSSRDAAIAQNFGPVCEELRRQDGLDFGESTTAYECRVRIPRMNSEFVWEKYEHDSWWTNVDPETAAQYIADLKKAESNFENIFQLPLSPTIYHSSLQAADDLVESSYTQSANENVSIPHETSHKKGIPLGYYSGQDAIDATIIILSNTNGTMQKFLLSRQELNENLKSINTLGGAISLLFLRRLTDAISNLGNNGGIRNDFGAALCTAKEINADRKGWDIIDATIHPACRSTVLTSFRVDRNGQAKTTKRANIGVAPNICE